MRFAALRKFDWMMLLAVFVLIVLGLAAIYSVALSRGSGMETVTKQLFAVVFGGAVFSLFAFGNYRQLRSFSMALYVSGLAMLVAVLLFGAEVNGAKSWFQFPGFSFQPVEFMKIALAVTLARYFGEKARRNFGWRELFASGTLTAVPVGLVLLQPDAGSAGLLVLMWCVLLFFAGIKLRQVVPLLLLGAVAATSAWFLVFKDYQRERVLTFLDPSRDPLGRGYNVNQALIGIGAGGTFGRGLGFGSQSQLKFIPASHTDFIFAVIAEELGFFGVTLLLVAFSVLGWHMYVFARTTNDDFTSFLVLGLGAGIFIQTGVNIGMNLGLSPVTGVTLPFVSYGGSSLVTALAAAGILESVASHRS